MELHGTLDAAMILGIVFGAGILWRGHQTIAAEVKELRTSRDEHAKVLERVVTLIDGLERRIDRVEDRP